MYTQHAKLIDAMIEYDKGDARRIQHFIKVHDLAATIAALENADEETTFILETAAILHDIGIHISEAKYGSASGHYQELEGPAEAEKLMQKVGGYNASQIERVMYLIGHHHTYNNIDGMIIRFLSKQTFLLICMKITYQPKLLRMHAGRYSGLLPVQGFLITCFKDLKKYAMHMAYFIIIRYYSLYDYMNFATSFISFLFGIFGSKPSSRTPTPITATISSDSSIASICLIFSPSRIPMISVSSP